MAFAWIIGTTLAASSPRQVIAGLSRVALPHARRRDAAVRAGRDERDARAARAPRGAARARQCARRSRSCSSSSPSCCPRSGRARSRAVALLIPLAMAIGTRAGVPRFLTALMVANGANAGNLSPISAVGVIANAKMAEAGLAGHGVRMWMASFVAHALVSAAAYLLLGGHRLVSACRRAGWRRRTGHGPRPTPSHHDAGHRGLDRRRRRLQAERRAGGVRGGVGDHCSRTSRTKRHRCDACRGA